MISVWDTSVNRGVREAFGGGVGRAGGGGIKRVGGWVEGGDGVDGGERVVGVEEDSDDGEEEEGGGGGGGWESMEED